MVIEMKTAATLLLYDAGNDILLDLLANQGECGVN